MGRISAFCLPPSLSSPNRLRYRARELWYPVRHNFYPLGYGEFRTFRGRTVCLSSQNLPDDLKVQVKKGSVSVLPLEVVQRIASGEVISDYTSVVQELVENSLDAKSTDIKIDVDISSRSVIVSDNGEGIGAVEDLLKVTQCNATSKLSNLDEFESGVSTLGFRGQGLWAVAASTESLTISSRPSHRAHGYVLRFDGQSPAALPRPVPMSKGTVVSAVGLPWTLNTVHRTSAFRKCKLFLFRMALTHPGVLFHLSRGGRPVWSSAHRLQDHTESSDVSSVTAILARHVGVPVSVFRGGVFEAASLGSMLIAVGMPSAVSLSSGESMVVAINGRPVRNDMLNKAVVAACAPQRGRFPAVFVGVHTPPSIINWNICPTKSRMRFRDENLSTMLTDAVKGALSSLLSAAPDLFESRIIDHVPGSVPRQPASVVGLLTSMQRRAMQLEQPQTENVDMSRTFINERSATYSDSEIGMFGARVVAQVLNTYILVEHNGGIMLIEQHVADERAIYEKLCDSWHKKAFVSLDEPIRLSGTTSDEILFRLSTLGLDAAPEHPGNSVKHTEEGASGYLIERVPEIVSNLAREDLQRLICLFSKEDTTIESAAANVSCRLAVRNGRSLDDRKMKAIVKNLFTCSNAHTCPHGRPIFHEVGIVELAALFKRSWSPEKLDTINRGSVLSKRAKRTVVNGIIEEL